MIDLTIFLNLLDSVGNKYLELLCCISDISKYHFVIRSKCFFQAVNVQFFLYNFAIFTGNVAATNSKCGIEIYFFKVTLAFPIMKLQCIAPAQFGQLKKL